MSSLFTMEGVAGIALFYLSFTRFMSGNPLLGSVILCAALINYFVMYVKGIERLHLANLEVEEEEEEEEDPLLSPPLEEDAEAEPIKEEPSSSSPEVEFLECAQCGTLIESDLAGMCNGCMKVVYCDEVCQRTHWKNGHKEQCKATRKRKRGVIV